MLRFWWKLDSDYDYAHSQLSAVDQASNQHGSEQLAPGDGAWRQDVVGLPAGRWQLRWSPSWDFWCCGGDSNTLWLDQVSFEPGQPRYWLDPQSYDLNGGRFLYFHGALGQSYQIEVSEDLFRWSSLTQVTCEDFVMSVIDQKVGAASRFYRARTLP